MDFGSDVEVNDRTAVIDGGGVWVDQRRVFRQREKEEDQRGQGADLRGCLGLDLEKGKNARLFKQNGCK